MTPEWKECYAEGIWTEFMEQRGPGHTCGGKNVFIKGFDDYKQEIQEALDSLDYLNDPEASDKAEELKAMLIDCDAICILGRDTESWLLKRQHRGGSSEKEGTGADRRELQRCSCSQASDILAGSPALLVRSPGRNN